MTLATNSGANLGHFRLVDVQSDRDFTVGAPTRAICSTAARWPLVRQLYLRTIVMGAWERLTELAQGDERIVLGRVNHARWTGDSTILDLAMNGSRQIEHFLGWGNSSRHPLYEAHSCVIRFCEGQ